MRHKAAILNMPFLLSDHSVAQGWSATIHSAGQILSAQGLSAVYVREGQSMSWWRHEIDTFSALLALCAGNSPVTGEFPSQRPVTQSFGVFFDLRLNKRLTKQSCGWWFETPSRSLWRHSTGPKLHHLHIYTAISWPKLNKLVLSNNCCKFNRIILEILHWRAINLSPIRISKYDKAGRSPNS